MQLRPAVTLLTLALVGCGIGDNDSLVAGGGDGGEGGDASDPDDPGEDDADDEDDVDPSGTSGGGGGGDGGGSDDSGSGGEGEAGCGDGVLEIWEVCDDGNDIDADGCDADCTPTIGVQTFALGRAHTCAVDYAGLVRCFGDNRFGQLGYGDPIAAVGDDETPYEFGRSVRLGARVAHIALGANHTCALTYNGEVYCWGRNDAGQLGLGHDDHIGDDLGEAPNLLGRVTLSAPADMIAAGRRHTCAVLVTGEVQCWGEGHGGQLGLGTGFEGTAGAGDKPYMGVMQAPKAEMLNAHVSALAIGLGDFSCIVDQFDQVRCWGANDSGQLGVASTERVGDDEPAGMYHALLARPVAQVAVGERHTCVVDDKAATRCFGGGASGQLGTGDTENIGDDEAPLEAIIHLDGIATRKVVAGAEFSCALMGDATVRCWGDGTHGQLASGRTDAIGDDEWPSDAAGFGPVKLLEAATDLAAGAEHVCARTADARLRCWGKGADGRLGHGDEHNIGDTEASLPIFTVPIFQAP